MTTNKPNVRRYVDIGSGQICPINNLYESDDGKYVLYEDYEAKQAECEKLRRDAERYRWLMERGDDFQWENIIRLDIEDFPSRCAAIDTAMLEENK